MQEEGIIQSAAFPHLLPFMNYALFYGLSWIVWQSCLKPCNAYSCCMFRLLHQKIISHIYYIICNFRGHLRCFSYPSFSVIGVKVGHFWVTVMCAGNALVEGISGGRCSIVWVRQWIHAAKHVPRWHESLPYHCEMLHTPIAAFTIAAVLSFPNAAFFTSLNFAACMLQMRPVL